VQERRGRGSNAVGDDKGADFTDGSCRRRRRGNFGRPWGRKDEVTGESRWQQVGIWTQMQEGVIGEQSSFASSLFWR
jgi:hypothetical protein